MTVSVDGTGDGSGSDPVNISFALNNIAKDGKINIRSGSYDLMGQTYNVNFVLNPENGVIITNGSLSLQKGYLIKDLTFTHLSRYLSIGYESTIENCTFMHNNITPIYLEYNTTISNCKFIDCNSTYIFQHHTHGINSLNVVSLNISNSNFTYLSHINWGASNALFKNINISNSEFNTLLQFENTGVYQDINKVVLSGFNITDSDIKENLFTSTLRYTRSLEFNDVTVDNCDYKGNIAFIKLYSNCKVNNLVINLKYNSDINIIHINNSGCVISGVNISNFETALGLINSTAPYNLLGLVL